jgi:hypothetical protein
LTTNVARPGAGGRHDVAAPIDLAIAANANVAAPIDAAVSANILSFGSESAALAGRDRAGRDGRHERHRRRDRALPTEGLPTEGVAPTADSLLGGNLLNIDVNAALDANLTALPESRRTYSRGASLLAR